MFSFKILFLFFISLSLLQGCLRPDRRTDVVQGGSFEVKSIKAINLSESFNTDFLKDSDELTADFSPNPSFANRHRYTLKACVQDRYSNSPIIGQSFQVQKPKDSQVENLQKGLTDQNGCFTWHETLDFNFLEDKDRYIRLKRWIRGSGVYEGQREINIGINPWHSSRGGKGLVQQVIDLERDGSPLIKPKNEVSDDYKVKFLQNATNVTLTHDQPVEQGHYIEILMQLKPKLALPHLNGSGYVQHPINAKSEFQAEIHLIGQEKNKNNVILTQPTGLTEVYSVDERNTLTIKYKANIFRNTPAGNIYMVVVLRPVGNLLKNLKASGNKNFKKSSDFIFSEVYHIHSNGLNSGSTKPIKIPNLKITADPFGRDDSKEGLTEFVCGLLKGELSDQDYSQDGRSHLKSLSICSNLKEQDSQGIGIKQYHYELAEITFVSGAKHQTTNMRRMKFNVRTCIRDGVFRDRLREGNKYTISRYPKSYLFPSYKDWEKEIVTDEGGCLSFEGEIEFNFYQSQRFFFTKYELSESDVPDSQKQYITVAVNPWKSATRVFAYDLRWSSHKIKEINELKRPVPKFQVNGFRYETQNIFYKVDNYLNLKLVRAVNLKFSLAALRYDDIVEGRKIIKAQDGLYLLKTAIYKRYIDPFDKVKNSNYLSEKERESLLIRSQSDEEDGFDLLAQGAGKKEQKKNLEENVSDEKDSNDEKGSSEEDEKLEEEEGISEEGEKLAEDKSEEEGSDGDDESSEIKQTDEKSDLKKIKYKYNISYDSRIVKVSAGEINVKSHFEITDPRLMNLRNYLVLQVEPVNEVKIRIFDFIKTPSSTEFRSRLVSLLIFFNNNTAFRSLFNIDLSKTPSFSEDDVNLYCLGKSLDCNYLTYLQEVVVPFSEKSNRNNEYDYLLKHFKDHMYLLDTFWNIYSNLHSKLHVSKDKMKNFSSYLLNIEDLNYFCPNDESCSKEQKEIISQFKDLGKELVASILDHKDPDYLDVIQYKSDVEKYYGKKQERRQKETNDKDIPNEYELLQKYLDLENQNLLNYFSFSYINKNFDTEEKTKSLIADVVKSRSFAGPILFTQNRSYANSFPLDNLGCLYGDLHVCNKTKAIVLRSSGKEVKDPYLESDKERFDVFISKNYISQAEKDYSHNVLDELNEKSVDYLIKKSKKIETESKNILNIQKSLYNYIKLNNLSYIPLSAKDPITKFNSGLTYLKDIYDEKGELKEKDALIKCGENNYSDNRCYSVVTTIDESVLSLQKFLDFLNVDNNSIFHFGEVVTKDSLEEFIRTEKVTENIALSLCSSMSLQFNEEFADIIKEKCLDHYSDYLSQDVELQKKMREDENICKSYGKDLIHGKTQSETEEKQKMYCSGIDQLQKSPFHIKAKYFIHKIGDEVSFHGGRQYNLGSTAAFNIRYSDGVNTNLGSSATNWLKAASDYIRGVGFGSLFASGALMTFAYAGFFVTPVAIGAIVGSLVVGAAMIVSSSFWLSKDARNTRQKGENILSDERIFLLAQVLNLGLSLEKYRKCVEISWNFDFINKNLGEHEDWGDWALSFIGVDFNTTFLSQENLNLDKYKEFFPRKKIPSGYLVCTGRIIDSEDPEDFGPEYVDEIYAFMSQFFDKSDSIDRNILINNPYHFYFRGIRDLNLFSRNMNLFPKSFQKVGYWEAKSGSIVDESLIPLKRLSWVYSQSVRPSFPGVYTKMNEREAYAFKYPWVHVFNKKIKVRTEESDEGDLSPKIESISPDESSQNFTDIKDLEESNGGSEPSGTNGEIDLNNSQDY